jgi:DNA-binding NtrC family response regulator
MSPKTQVDFLRVLQDREFRRVGGTRPITVDVRFIAATNRDLEGAVRAGGFREDLFYRLAVVPITLPPLRERTEDLPLLAAVFLKEFCARYRRPEKWLATDTLQVLREYRWPGNVRELRNLMERLVVTVPARVIRPVHLPSTILTGKRPERAITVPLGIPLAVVEEQIIRRTLREVTSHREHAARLLGISPRALHYKIKRYGLEGRTAEPGAPSGKEALEGEDPGRVPLAQSGANVEQEEAGQRQLQPGPEGEGEREGGGGPDAAEGERCLEVRERSTDVTGRELGDA